MVGFRIVRHDSPINRRIKKPYLIRATKFEVLHFIRDAEIICKNDLVDHFGYKPKGAVQRIWRLARDGLIIPIPTPGQWRLSELGEKRYQYYIKKEQNKKITNEPL